jgi:hypothetical protein
VTFYLTPINYGRWKNDRPQIAVEDEEEQCRPTGYDDHV